MLICPLIQVCLRVAGLRRCFTEAPSKAAVSTKLKKTLSFFYFKKAVMSFLDVHQGAVSHPNLGNLRNGGEQKTSVSHQVKRESQQL